MPSAAHFAACLLDEPLQIWIIKTARKNHWRVARWYELDDLIADGYLTAAKIRNRYSTVNQKHFMALVMTAYMNHITNMARKRRRGDDIRIIYAAPQTVDIDWWLSSLLGEEHNNGMVSHLMTQAKHPVDIVIKLFTTAQGIAEIRHRPRRPRETANHYICRLVGVDPDQYNVLALVESFVRGTGIYFLRQPV
jgi:hypothetical protein